MKESTSTPTAPDTQCSNDSNYKYVDDVCIYTDPNTKKEYTWNKEKKTWTEKGFENYQYDELRKTYKYVDKETSILKHLFTLLFKQKSCFYKIF